VDAAGLPGLGGEAERILAHGLRDMGLQPPPEVLSGMDAHARLLAAWGQAINLTAIREPTAVVTLHVLDSLAAIGPIRARRGSVASMVDIGSGGGYPGIPVGLLLGVQRLSLVESVGRKARFLEVAAAAVLSALGAGTPLDIEVLPVRAEALARDAHRGSWDIATIRAVGSLAECAELGLPLLRTGGLLVCWKRDPIDRDGVERPTVRSEIAAARGIIADLGGGAPEAVPAGVPGAPGHRLVLVSKDRATPTTYPRTPAVRRSGSHGHRS
jgi:16S rRNA (guanine527-N7)-methyltransferase